ncbi:MAG: hypothetical protein ACTSRA_07895 [Promethearchaeota archaeon]
MNAEQTESISSRRADDGENDDGHAFGGNETWFQAVISTGRLKSISTILDGIFRSLVDETYFYFDREGIKISALDPGRVAVTLLHLSKDDFHGRKYNLYRDRFRVGIRIKDFCKSIKIIPNRVGTIGIKVRDGDLQLIIGNRIRTLKSIEIQGDDDEEKQLINGLENNLQEKIRCSFNMKIDEVLEHAKAANQLSEQMVIRADDTGLTLETPEDGDARDEVKIDLNNMTGMIWNWEHAGGEARGVYNLKLLISFLNGIQRSKLSSKVKFFLGVDVVLKMEVVFDNSRLVYFLAPRIYE